MANPPTYRDLLDFHEKLTKEDPRFAGMSLTELSTQMNTAEGTNEYDAGLRDGFLPRMSVKVDKALENSGVSKFSGDVFKHVANEYVSPMVGRDTAAGFEQMGKDIPRMLGEGAVAAYGLTAGLQIGRAHV